MSAEITQKEKRQVLENDRKVKATYHSHAIASVDDERGGRYASAGSATTVIGATPIQYPAMPEGNPWRADPVPNEPLIDGTGEGLKLGYKIDKPNDGAA